MIDRRVSMVFDAMTHEIGTGVADKAVVRILNSSIDEIGNTSLCLKVILILVIISAWNLTLNFLDCRYFDPSAR